MNRSLLLTTISICVSLCACKSSDPVHLQPTLEEPKQLAAVVRMGDASVGAQLLNGFGAIENQSWRWAAPHFAVALGVPPGADKNGASLTLSFTLPDVILQSLKRLTVSGKAGSVVLDPETFDTAGAHTYKRDLPASAFTSGTALQVQYDVDKFLKTDADKRQLSMVVTAIQLEPK